MLGLVHVPGHVGLEGHSDADAAAHALCDALLGAVNQGDLGRHFPDSDPAFKGASSAHLLRECVAIVSREGYVVENADVTIVAEAPRLALFMPAMSAALSEIVDATVSVKATTAEGLGALGRTEGIGALAIVLVKEKA
jgi:2-C-methyl-D-erythritol 2,4-cyclodiphosphate synthase